MFEDQKSDDKRLDPDGTIPDTGPIEPKGTKIGTPNLLKWLFFLLVIIYSLLAYYHAPILKYLGSYLIVKHQAQKSDLIVCLAGRNVERGLAAADAYQKKLASRIFMTREELPDGHESLREKGIIYPESADLLTMILTKMGVPGSAILISDRPAKSTFDEAKIVKDLVKEKGFRSLILVTSPVHTRRAWLTYRKLFEKDDIRILVFPSPYSKFNPENWWKERKYVREVIIEYEKLIYYVLKHLW